MRYASALPPIVPALVLVVTLVAACSGGPEVYEKSMEVAGYDFTEYTEQGFLITPESYQGEYQSIGVLSVTVWPRIEQKPVEDTLAQPGPDNPAQVWLVTEDVDPQEVIDSLYAEAQSMGADAVMNFRTEPVKEDLDNGPTRSGVRARGYAIDRVDR